MSGSSGSGAARRGGAHRATHEPWWRGRWRAGAAALTALAGLGLVAFGPAGVVMGVRDVTQRQAAAAASRYQVGTEVRDGPVAFVVHEVQCGAAPELATQGQLCLVTVAARNDGDERLKVPRSAQVLHGADRARHWPTGGDPTPFGSLKPGETATAVLVFDLPPASVPTHVEVHADAYSAGQVVAVDRPLPLLSATAGSD
jgi:hypothetical protein